MKFHPTLLLLILVSTSAPAQTALDEQIALARQSAHTVRRF